MIEPILRFLSVFGHAGRCRECRISWNYREHMEPVAYEGGELRSSAFPLCQSCFDDLDTDEITRHFKAMWLTDWKREANPVAWRIFRKNVSDRKTLDRDHTRYSEND